MWLLLYRPLHNQSNSATPEDDVALKLAKNKWEAITIIAVCLGGFTTITLALAFLAAMGDPLPSHATQTPAATAPRGIITVATAAPGRHYLGAWADGLPTERSWHIQTRVRWHDVQGQAYMESEQHFADGSVFFTRTLADSGPMAGFTGSSDDWREVVLPFDASATSAALTSVQVTLIMAGAGTVEIETPRLIEGLPR